MSLRFERFVGIDWSGAKNEFQRGIQIAEFLRSDTRPKIKSSPSGGKWSRPNVFDYIVSLTEQPTLVGIDFAFSVPWGEGATPLPECIAALSKVDDLWLFVDEFCKDERFFYAGPMWHSENSPLRSFLLCVGHKGPQFSNARLRLTDLATKPRPETIYKIVGAKTVGAGSFAGMRVLHALRQLRDKRIAIWPFDNTERADVVIAEIYPSAFYAMAKQRRPNLKKDSHEVVEKITRAVLDHFKIFAECRVDGMSGDQLDAFIASAALAYLAEQPAPFRVPNSLISSVIKEGWIFGVPFGDGI
jgi:hypothetical protein